MLTKIVALLQTKAAVAVLGAVLVGGAGTAAAVTATTHEIPFTQIHIGSAGEGTPEAHDGENHNEVGIEGVLKAYDAKALTITVQTTADKIDEQTADKSEATTTSATATTEHETDAKATASASVTLTITVDAHTRVNGDHAKTLADLSANIGHKVEVQAEKQSNGTYIASKVTVSHDMPNAEGNNEDKHGESTPGAQNQEGQHGETHDASGTVSAIGADFFQITERDGGKTLTVSVSAATVFTGTAHNLGDLKVGYNVDVKGTLQSNGTLAATSVSSQGAHS